MNVRTTELGRQTARTLIVKGTGTALRPDARIELLLDDKDGRNGFALLVDGERRAWAASSQFPPGSFEESDV
jgi:hypothetical protein